MTKEDNLNIEETTAEPSISLILKEKRISMNMEISEVSSFLKVKIHDIQAIENDNWGAITKHVYIAGIIRSYARLLEIDPKTLEKKIEMLYLMSNTDEKKHRLINIGENLDLKPNKDQFFNFLLVSVLLFLTLLILCNFYENKKGLITSDVLVRRLTSYSKLLQKDSIEVIEKDISEKVKDDSVEKEGNKFANKTVKQEDL